MSRALVVFLLSGALLFHGHAASAADTVRHTAKHTTKRSADHVFKVLTAYGQICDSGCKYYGPDVVEFIKLSHRSTSNSFYTWTWVSSVKDVKYFSHVAIQKQDGKFTLVTRMLNESDKDLIKELSEKAGREHNPTFASGTTKFTVVEQRDAQGKLLSTSVTQAMTIVVSGFLSMFKGKIKDGMLDGAKATFANIEK
jgi:hypothetical protein